MALAGALPVALSLQRPKQFHCTSPALRKRVPVTFSRQSLASSSVQLGLNVLRPCRRRQRGQLSATVAIFREDPIGAEHGEGFTSYRPSGGPLHLDVELLNEKLRHTGEKRLRHSFKPDEAFGVICTWDNVLADTRALQLSAWMRLAAEEGRVWPSVERPIYNTPPERVITEVLLWTRNWPEVKRLTKRVGELYVEAFRQNQQPLDGVKEWLEAVRGAGVPCAIACRMDRASVVAALERMELRDCFQAVVTDEDDMESMAQRFLSAAVKVDRPPRKCIVFEDDPRGITAAHNCSMKAVAILGAHKAYELKQADLAVQSMSELSVINLRRLFANQGSEFMDLKPQKADKKPRRRRLGIDMIP